MARSAILPLLLMGCSDPARVGQTAGMLTSVSNKIQADDLATGGWFGFSVGIDGPAALIGAHGASAAYVFRETPNGWEQTQKLTGGTDFGWGVALGGGWGFVGDPSTYRSLSDSGSVYVYHDDGSSLQVVQVLTPSPEARGFGSVAAVDADTLVVGAHYTGAGWAGSAFAYTVVNGAWSQQAQLLATDQGFNDELGYSVAVSGELIVLGAPRHDHGGALETGAAFVYERVGASWSQVAELKGSDSAFGDRFGAAVAISGDTVVVGAPHADNFTSGQPFLVDQAGSAYVFQRTGGIWTEVAKLTGSVSFSNLRFALSLAMSPDRILAGARDSWGPPSTGSAYVFRRSSTGWELEDRLVAFDPDEYDFLGNSVALRGNRALLGADGVGGNVNVSPGAAYLVDLLGVTGGPCSLPTECASGQCVSGVCCEACEAPDAGVSLDAASADVAELDVQDTGFESDSGGSGSDSGTPSPDSATAFDSGDASIDASSLDAGLGDVDPRDVDPRDADPRDVAIGDANASDGAGDSGSRAPDGSITDSARPGEAPPEDGCECGCAIERPNRADPFAWGLLAVIYALRRARDLRLEKVRSRSRTARQATSLPA
ncbi:MAG: hypothetical protein HY791_24605 [Deltaproteobacteria bacterium]|nr:hypothetical protein [Deltaproteobacteria bacterium]